MTEITKILPLPPPSAIASYNFDDVNQRTGTIIYLGFVSNATGGDDYHLSKDITFSSLIELKTAYAVDGFNAYEEVVNKDFDLAEFNLPADIKGTAYVAFTYNVSDNGSFDPTSKFQVLIKHVTSGGTPTEIGNAVSSDEQQSANTTAKYNIMMPITIPLTHFKRGEKLRLTIIGSLKSAGNPGTATGDMTFGTDPEGKDGVEIVPSTDSPITTTKLRSWIPFRLTEI